MALTPAQQKIVNNAKRVLASSKAALAASKKSSPTKRKTSTTPTKRTNTTQSRQQIVDRAKRALGGSYSSTTTKAPTSYTPTSSSSATMPMQYLSEGMTGSEVLKLQNYLVSQNFLTPAQVQTGPGIYGPQTKRAVMAFQQARGVDNSTGPGEWGPRTIAAAQRSSGGGAPTPEAEQPYPEEQYPEEEYEEELYPEEQYPEEEAWDDDADFDDSVTGGTPYIMGEASLVRFVGTGPRGDMNDQTIWFMDPETKTLRPFQNASSISNFFEEPVDIRKIKPMSASDLMPGGLLGPQNGEPGYELLSSEYAIKPDGSGKELAYSNAQLATRYGMGVNEDLEEESWLMLKGMLDQFEMGGISPSTIRKIKKDDTKLAYYINAMAYGGYSVPDIYRDMKARELGMDGIKALSATAVKSEHRKTDEYMRSTSEPDITPPPMIGNLDMSGLEDLAVYNLPEEAFKTLIPIMDYDSPQFKEAMENIETSYYDLLDIQLNAATEQEKAIADHSWNEFREEVEKNFGIALSDNAIQAWPQLEAAFNQFSQQGTMGSGLMNESIDDYLTSVRRQDQKVRDEEMDSTEKEEMKYLLSFATADQIKELVDSDPEKAARWGLKPSEETLANLNLATLTQKYPNAKPEDLQLYISTILDENGNYRSNLYQKKMGSMVDLANPNLQTSLGIKASKEDFQRSEALRKSLLTEEQAYREFTKPDVAFLRNVDRDDASTQSLMGGNTGSRNVTDFSKRISQAGLNYSRSQQPPTPSPLSSAPESNAPTPSTNQSRQQIIDRAKQALGGSYKPYAPSTTRTPTTPSTTPPKTTPSTPTTPTQKKQSSPTKTKALLPSNYTLLGPNSKPAPSAPQKPTGIMSSGNSVSTKGATSALNKTGPLTSIKNLWGRLTSRM